MTIVDNELEKMRKEEVTERSEVLSRNFSERIEEKLRKTSFRIAGARTEIQTEYLPYSSHKHYHLGQTTVSNFAIKTEFTF
jgi:hypothetical protein